MNHTFLGQVRQEGCWVPIYDFGHRVGADALILADKSIYSCQVFVKMLDGENDTEFSTATLLHTGWDTDNFTVAPSLSPCPIAGFYYNPTVLCCRVCLPVYRGLRGLYPLLFFHPLPHFTCGMPPSSQSCSYLTEEHFISSRCAS